MVKCKTYGRCGNFLFQVATAISYAKDHGQDFTIPTSTKDPFANPVYLPHLANPNWDPSLPTICVCEHGHFYQDIPWSEAWASGNVILDGYWQSEKYFKHRREEILDLFGYHWSLRRGIVSVHVRRGDYLRLVKKHPPVSAEWYRQAMRQFPGYAFRFFSDEIAWCQKEFANDPNCTFAVGGSIEQDLVNMSCCEHHICSASTFAWWGAWLNRNDSKRVIMPKLWFTPQEEKRCSSRDIIPKEWERL